MLNDTTKRNIQAARDVLVGKVPDPKAQVEQITTALIYKFMHDLDQQSVHMGGQARFFTAEYAQFAWPNLLDTRLTGEKRLDLYMRAITGMERNPNLPQLFRDIFKGAFLPYNDPQTLSLFLKEIDKFNYTHSEELGNAYEMLLSIMSSQGDAGQFRTPRHIIDFMVAVVDPKKHETILDPACGTAGFLISAFKHIRKHNSSNFQAQKNHVLADGESAVETYLRDDPAFDGNQLTPEEKKRLMSNIQGYDISPDMVRLSRVNLYLHGFQSPRISEYDTITSEDRWDDSFDVILANPPFMSPKGGIQPHKRFQVQARRSEVLFVDYILEHLNLNGRAGIIIPEGVIFRNETAYKQLRKLLVDDGLYCVVSLPAGVFNPYSGVKTSILFFDKALAKKQDEILFVKVENDGFDLGAQRRKIDKNDLPAALKVIRTWQHGENAESDLAFQVRKEKINKNDELILSYERYMEREISLNRNWPLVRLGDTCKILNGFAFESKKFNNSKKGLPIIRIRDVNSGFSETYYEGEFDKKYLIDNGDMIIGMDGDFKIVFWENGKALLNQRVCKLFDFNNILKEFAYHFIKRELICIHSKTYSVTVKHISSKQIEDIQIPLPPLEVQRNIVEQIEVKQAAIDAARAVIAALEKERRFFARELQSHDDVQWVELGEVANFGYGYTDSAKDSGDVRFIRITDITENGKLNPENPMFINLSDESQKYLLSNGDILVARTGATFGKTMVFSQDYQAVFASYLIRIKFRRGLVDPNYYWLFAQSDDYWNQANKLRTGGGQPQFNANAIKRIRIPLIPINLQQKYIYHMKNEDEIISTNVQMIYSKLNEIEQILDNV